MADKSIGISLRDTFESMIFVGNITGNGSFWSGVIDSEKVHEGLVSNPVKRQELKEAIISLEEHIKAIRQKGTPQVRDAFYHIKIQEYANKIFDIVAYHTDIELYLIYLIQKFDSIKETNPEEFGRINTNCKKQMDQNRKIILKGNAVFAYPVYINGKDEYGFETELIPEQESKLKKKGNDEKLIQFLNVIYGKKELLEEREVQFLDEVCEKLHVMDLVESLFCPSLKRLFFESFLKNYLRKSGMSREEIEELTPEKLRDLSSDMYAVDQKEVYKQVLSDTLLTHLDYVSVDKIILAFLQRSMEEYTRTAQISFDFDEIYEESRNLQDLIKRVIDSRLISTNASINMMTVNGEQNVSLRTIKSVQQECIDGVYLTPEIIAVMKDMLFRRQSILKGCDENIINRFDYSSFDYEVICLVDFDNLQRLHEVGKIDKSFINRLVRNCSLDIYGTLQEQEDRDDSDPFNNIKFPTKMELITFLMNSKLIDYKDLYEYYSLNQITLDELNQIKTSLKIEEQAELANKMIEYIDIVDVLNCYKKYSEKYKELIVLENNADKNQDEIGLLKVELDTIRKRKEKLVALYKEYTKDIPEEKLIESGNEIVETFYMDMQVSDETILRTSIISMYEDGFITLENIIYLSSDYIIPMLDKLSFQDIDRIKASMTRESLLAMLDTVFKDSSITEDQKFIIIMNMLGDETEEDRKAKEHYRKALKKDGKEKKAEPTGKKKDKTDGTTNTSKTYVYSDTIKWKFFRALDKDARVKKYSNGYVEFASEKFGVRFIEKYYDGDDLAYGTATCVVPEQVYKDNYLSLVTSYPTGMVLEGPVLRSITPRKDRIHHRTHSAKKTWMEDLVKYLGIDLDKQLDLKLDSVYTPEELENLRSVIEIYKNSYIEIEK